MEKTHGTFARKRRKARRKPSSENANIFTAPPAQLWVPLALSPEAWSERSSHYLEVIGRLKLRK